MTSFTQKNILFGVVFFSLLISFQNCSSDGGKSKDQKIVIGGSDSKSLEVGTGGNNGEGYLGKLYVNLGNRSECSDGSNIQSAVRVDDRNIARVERADCRSVTPFVTDFSSLHLAPHNTGNLVMNEKLYSYVPNQTSSMVDKSKKVSILFCRKNSTAKEFPGLPIGNGRPDQVYMYDIVVNSQFILNEWKFSADVLVGSYDSSSNITGTFQKSIAVAGVEHLSGGSQVRLTLPRFDHEPAIVWGSTTVPSASSNGILHGFKMDIFPFGETLKASAQWLVSRVAINTGTNLNEHHPVKTGLNQLEEDNFDFECFRSNQE